jgi:hypothetical protein
MTTAFWVEKRTIAGPDGSGLRVRVFAIPGSPALERADVELLENGAKRRLASIEGPRADLLASAWMEGYAAGHHGVAPLRPQARAKGPRARAAS